MKENEEIIGICRKSRTNQNIERQVRNILNKYPNARIIKITCSGAKVIGYKDFEKVIKEVKENKKNKNYKLVFDSASRMSRDSEGGCELYEDLFNHNVSIEFLKEPQINTDVFRKTLNNQIELQAKTGNEATDKLINTVIQALNYYTIALAKEQIKKVFDEAETELKNIHQRTSEGLLTAKLNGKRVGTPKGTKLTTKKSIEAKEIIIKHYKVFGNGTLNATETMKLAGIDKNTFYKYKRELLEEQATNIEDTI